MFWFHRIIVILLMKISENRLHLSNSSELDCIRFALSLHREKEIIAAQRCGKDNKK